MKRDQSRFTIDELNLVITNWESISKEFLGKFKIAKNTIDMRPIVYQAINKENIDRLETVLFNMEIKIPFKGKTIIIKTSETKTTIFEVYYSKPKFSFTVSNEDYFEKILKLFGSNEFQVDDYNFDKKYLLDTNDQVKFKKFLDYKIRNWLMDLKICYFDLDTPKAKNKMSIYCIINELSINKIREQIEMIKYCIEKLAKI